MDENAIETYDVITDERNNFYQPAKITTGGGKLLKLQVSNIYYETAFETMFFQVIESKEYQHKHIGSYLQDTVDQKVERMNSLGKKIYTLEEIFNAGVELSFSDPFTPHPRSVVIR